MIDANFVDRTRNGGMIVLAMTWMITGKKKQKGPLSRDAWRRRGHGTLPERSFSPP